MDHHCPWVMNCVGFYNQKYFFLFLVYATALLLLVSLPLLIVSTIDIMHPAQPLAIYIVRLVFGSIFAILFLIISSLLALHVYLVSINKTTIEAMQSNSMPFSTTRYENQAPYPCDIFSLGLRKNWMQVLYYAHLVGLWKEPSSVAFTPFFKVRMILTK